MLADAAAMVQKLYRGNATRAQLKAEKGKKKKGKKKGWERERESEFSLEELLCWKKEKKRGNKEKEKEIARESQ